MFDRDANWRNHRWSFDADIVETAEVPILASLIEKYGWTFDDTFMYKFRGKAKQYVMRIRHYWAIWKEYSEWTEKPKDPFQKKLTEI